MYDLAVVDSVLGRIVSDVNRGIKLQVQDVRCMWWGCIVTYARCFIGGRRHSLDEDLVLAGAPEHFKALHQHILVLRDEFVGHRVNALEESITEAEIDQNGEIGHVLVRSEITLPPHSELERLQHLRRYVVRELGPLQKQLGKQILAQLQAMSPEQRLALDVDLHAGKRYWPVEDIEARLDREHPHTRDNVAERKPKKAEAWSCRAKATSSLTPLRATT